MIVGVGKMLLQEQGRVGGCGCNEGAGRREKVQAEGVGEYLIGAWVGERAGGGESATEARHADHCRL
jgi:hypothetical protein